MNRFSTQYQPTNPFLAQSGVHRYGFQAQEQDRELWEGAVSFKYRVEDARLGRFFSVDPLTKDFPWNSNFAFSENQLIAFGELEGLEKTQRTKRDAKKECDAFRNEGKQGKRFKEERPNKPKLSRTISVETYERVAIVHTIVLNNPAPGAPLNLNVQLGNTQGQIVQLAYDMNIESDDFAITDLNTGATISGTNIAGIGTSNPIPNGVTDINIQIMPTNRASTSSIYTASLQITELRLVKTTTVFDRDRNGNRGTVLEVRTRILSRAASATTNTRLTSDNDANNDPVPSLTNWNVLTNNGQNMPTDYNPPTANIPAVPGGAAPPVVVNTNVIPQ